MLYVPGEVGTPLSRAVPYSEFVARFTLNVPGPVSTGVPLASPKFIPGGSAVSSVQDSGTSLATLRPNATCRFCPCVADAELPLDVTTVTDAPAIESTAPSAPSTAAERTTAATPLPPWPAKSDPAKRTTGVR